MVSIVTSGAVDRGVVLWSDKTDDYKIDVCFLWAKHATIWNMSKELGIWIVCLS